MTSRALAVLVSFAFIAGGIPALADDAQPELNFKFYNPEPAATQSKAAPASTDDSSAGLDASAAPAAAAPAAATPAPASAESKPASSAGLSDQDLAAPDPSASADATASPKADAGTDDQTKAASTDASADGAAKSANAADVDAPKGKDGEKIASKVLQGYIRVVPSGTKIPIIMDTAVDSDTSQEGDEFTARTGEDLTIDGATVLPAGSVIKGRIARIAAPKHLGRSGSVALKFDTVTTPDNRQIPIVANLVAHGGVVHARRGLKDIAIDSTTIVLPTAVGLGIGLLAGNSNSSTTTTTTTGTTSSSSGISKGTAAVIGVGVGAAVGLAILAIKKGKKVDVRPGDELKIELAEDLRMPM